MRFIDGFRDPELALKLVKGIERETDRELCLMEVCGTHTMAIARSGIRTILPENIRLLSGPGCPVCVTPQSTIDAFIGLDGFVLATFGDMLRVPGSSHSLEEARARGADVLVVYSPLDALEYARENPKKRVVFFGIGFETTAPAVALALLDAKKLRVENFYVMAAHKTIPAAMVALASDKEVSIDGFICPGHVSAIIGCAPYEAVGVPCVISGFEPIDILNSILMLVKTCGQGAASVVNMYPRVVHDEGNVEAMECIYSVFEESDSEWRGLGTIPGSGLRLRPEFAEFDASRFVIEEPGTSEEDVCECGSILRGVKSPAECGAFGNACTPERPLGPCMVSSEGACAAEYRYGRGVG